MKFKIIFEDYLRDEHVEAIKTMLSGLEGVEIIENDNEHLLISTNESMASVIEDMNLCDYLTAVKQ